MTDIEKNVKIAAPIEKVWTALIDPAAIGRWMVDEAVTVDLQAGGRFAFFGGETTGQFTRIERPHRLDYTWRQVGWHDDWPASLVRWELEPDGASTRIRLTHTQFPNAAERD
ncbi:MAG: SRPBCC family protein, partial [Anaerolineales bacterium]